MDLEVGFSWHHPWCMYYTQTYHLHGPSTLLERDILYTDTVISLSGDIVNGVRPDQEASFEVVTT